MSLNSNQKNSATSFWIEVRTLFLWVAFLVIALTSIGQAYRIPSSSMEDTLLIGDFVVANKFIYGARIPFTDWRLPAIHEPEPGDIVIFKYPGDGETPYVKRCIAVEGQVIEIRDKNLFIDNQKMPNPEFSKFVDSRIYPRSEPAQNGRDNWGPYQVPEDYYFMMGDNRDNSFDSRFWGPVHKDLIIGKPIIIHWSWEEDKNAPIVNPADPLSVPRLFVYNLIHFPERVRWDRLLNIVE